MAGVEQRVEFRGVFQHDGFEPSFRRAAIERVLGVAGERAAMEVEFMEQAFEGAFVGVSGSVDFAKPKKTPCLVQRANCMPRKASATSLATTGTRHWIVAAFPGSLARTRRIVSLAACSANSICSRETGQLSRFPAAVGSIFCMAASGSRIS
jgi:hypothetical protein